MSYDSEGKRTRYEDASGFVKEYDYDPHGRLWKVKHTASGKELRVVYPRELGAQVQGSLGLPKKVQY
ncbi:MAG: RHS repeat domain-containing protein [Planctomycetota bacterium]